MENTRKRVIASIVFSFIFILIWSVFSFATTLDSVRNNQSFIVLGIVALMYSTPFFLYSIFLINNQYRFLNDKVEKLSKAFFISFVFVVCFATIMTLTLNNKYLFLLNMAINAGIYAYQIKIAFTIYKETISLPEVSDKKRNELLFSDANVFGGSCLFLCIGASVIISFCGKHIVTYIGATLFSFLAFYLNYKKLIIILPFEHLNFKKNIITNNLSVIVFLLIAIFISDSNLLSLDKSNSHVFVSYFNFINVVTLIPIMKTNRVIGIKYKELLNTSK